MAIPSFALRSAIREAARLAFSLVRADHAHQRFYYFALVTTAKAACPVPCACSVEGLISTLTEYRQNGYYYDVEDLRWSVVDSPYFLYGDEYFEGVREMFDMPGHGATRPNNMRGKDIALRLTAMEGALHDLDREGFFGKGEDREKVVINVVMTEGEQDRIMFARAGNLNPAKSLGVMQHDLWG
ncbi:DUF4303 domain-containing protein [Pseudomonas sp. PDNC002]|uniref:DUF4303 domain-containing protein n=1 Tax=Pseudomonas sp. PDNC002 TaxID=2811422 RepID=UPI001963A998|nr:DUF4303 domain-containing protein [Pseudomonas sp. PDNC002]QRY81241.1 DUF4303 domain-containing protein [Pseudomonas sp. PDNC002]